MKQFTRNTIKMLCLGIILGASSILSSVAQTTVNENEKLIPFGDFNRWMVRVIDESFVIGGNTKILYEVAPVDTIRGDKPYIGSTVSPWRTSNVMAKVSGITKCSISVFPEKRDDGYCVRVETLMEKCKVLGIVNITVLVPGTIYLGQMHEPIKDTKNPQSKLNAGIPFTETPKAVVFDYKMETPGTDHRIKATGFRRNICNLSKTLGGRERQRVCQTYRHGHRTPFGEHARLEKRSPAGCDLREPGQPTRLQILHAINP